MTSRLYVHITYTRANKDNRGTSYQPAKAVLTLFVGLFITAGWTRSMRHPVLFMLMIYILLQVLKANHQLGKVAIFKCFLFLCVR